MKTKLWTLFAALLCCVMFAVGVSAATSGNYAYTVTNGEATITDVDSSISGAETLPSKLGGYPVTSIGDKAFRFCYSLTSITIPSSVTSIGDEAFSYCDRLTSITIPSSVTSIGDSAFSYCDSLTSITIPSSVTSIGYGAFQYCRSLTSITVSSSNKNYSSVDGVLFNKDKTTLIAYPAGKTAKEYTIPSSVTSIGDYAFFECGSLTSITIPSSVTSIGDYAFYSCYRLTSITIPSSVTSIGICAFSDCRNLTSITVSSSNKNYSSVDGVLFNKDKTTLIAYPAGKTAKEYTIPSSVTSIGDYAFFECGSLTSITIPSSVTSIGSYAFSCCYSLTSITILNSVTSIGGCAFSGCPSLTSITIPNSVTSIGYGAFSWCGNLTTITIPSSVTSIGGSAFYYCPNLTVYGYSGTYAETYANNNSIPFVSLVPTTYTISGKITSVGAGDITIALLQNGTPLEDVVITVDSEAGSYTIASVPAGTYTMRVSKPKHVTREYTVTVGNP